MTVANQSEPLPEPSSVVLAIENNKTVLSSSKQEDFACIVAPRRYEGTMDAPVQSAVVVPNTHWEQTRARPETFAEGIEEDEEREEGEEEEEWGDEDEDEDEKEKKWDVRKGHGEETREEEEERGEDEHDRLLKQDGDDEEEVEVDEKEGLLSGGHYYRLQVLNLWTKILPSKAKGS